MVDITHKSNTLRMAKASAILSVSSLDTIQAIKDGTVPKGDVFEMSKAAGLIGIKMTPQILPDCHPIPVEHAAISYDIQGTDIHIEVLIRTVYKTGVEVEAMHGATVVAMNMYDMLKPLDKEIIIREVKLLEKKGGKSDRAKNLDEFRAAVIVISDSVSAGTSEDRSGKWLKENLEKLGAVDVQYEIVPDEEEIIRQKVEALAVSQQLVITTGGTGFGPRDVTIKAVTPLITKSMDGIVEAARAYGQERIPTAMMSDSKAGLIGDTILMSMPGSSNAVKEYFQVIFPHILHAIHIIKGGRH